VQGRKGMDAVRWVVVAAVTGALLILPAAAFANAFFTGPVGSGYNNAGVEFRANLKHHHAKRVEEFRWFNVPVGSCYDSFDGLHFHMRVKDHQRFHGRYSVPNTDHKAIVHGKFTHHARKAKGTLELKGDFVGGCSNADSGALHWTAKKSGT
jgi:hypothetical protein